MNIIGAGKKCLAFCSLLGAFCACSFNYGESVGQFDDRPDLVMENVEYVRVRSGELQVKFTAEEAKRFESRQMMELSNYSFEQYDVQTEKLNAQGSGGVAEIEMDTGNVHLKEGIVLTVESEELTIETTSLDWQDEGRILTGEGSVHIQKGEEAWFEGKGFSADVRRETWEFSEGIKGVYVHSDDEEG
jgi:LPS export ABC transporter protein LptC